jgi:phospholipase D1/2
METRNASVSDVAVTGILRPGVNCWRVERTPRFYCIQDAADYFRLVRQAMLLAKHSIFTLGWDTAAAADLLPGEHPPDGPTTFKELVAHIARRNRDLRVQILTWDYASVYALERDPFARLKFQWGTPSNVTFAFDGQHAAGGSHHQKIVVIDDALAFCGGIDLTGHRWDTCAHEVTEPRRVNVEGHPYGPYHEVGALGDGALARALGELARERWRAVGVTDLPPVAPADGRDLWPETVEPDLRDVNVAISRTMPAIGDKPEIRECEALFVDSIAAARRSIYIESQYCTNDQLGATLGARLREPDGPEVILVSPQECHGWLEQNTVGTFRAVVFKHLLDADTHRRLRLVYPAASVSQCVPVFVHSKVMIGDDSFLRIGSANFSRRSMSVDSECDLAIDAAGDARVEEGIRRVRHRLVGEHLGLEVDEVAGALARAGSLRALIDARASEDRTLARVEVPPVTETPDIVRDVADPAEPIDLATTLESLVGADDRRPPAWRRWLSAAATRLRPRGRARAGQRRRAAFG